MSLFKTYISLFLLTGLLAACGLEVESDDESSREVDQRKELLKAHRAIAGHYVGEVTPFDGKKPYRVEIDIYSIEVRENLDSEGRPQFRPTLKVRMARNDSLEEVDFKTFEARFYKSDNSLVFSDSESLTFNGKFKKNRLTGTLTNKFGIIGALEASRVHTTAVAPSIGDESDRRNRFYNIYNNILGTYEGEIKPFETDREIFRVTLVLFISEEHEGLTPEGEPQLVPRLRARLSYIDYPRAGIDRTMNVRYFVKNSSVAMLANPRSSITSLEPIEFSITGKIVNGELTGTVTDQRKPYGTIKVTLHSRRYE